VGLTFDQSEVTTCAGAYGKERTIGAALGARAYIEKVVAHDQRREASVAHLDLSLGTQVFLACNFLFEQ
jgi:hypothetical protein